MIRKKIILFSIANYFIICLSLYAQQSTNSGKYSNPIQGTLKIIINQFKNDKGIASIMLIRVKPEDAEKKFDEVKPSMKKNVKIVEGKAEVFFIDLPLGDYAVFVFHDENENDKLDFRFFNPEEHRFSNNPKLGLIPKAPKIKDITFPFNQQNIEAVVIHIN